MFKMFIRYRKNLRKSTLVFIGTVPLANYQSLVAPAKQEYPTKDPYGWNPVATGGGEYSPSAPQLPPEYTITDSSPIGNLYPNLRELCVFLIIIYKRLLFKVFIQIHK